MSEWTSLSLKQETKDALDAQREDGESWDEFLQRCGTSTVEQSTTVESDVDTEHIEAQLDRIEERLKDFSVTQNQERVISRIDDHETEIKTWFEREFKR